MQTMDTADPIIHYPSSDGKRMAENTKQARWIMTLAGNLQSLYADRADVLVAADNLWYPIERNNTVCVAPDVYVVFGRPKGDRDSYRTWEEGGIPLTVTFEVLSPTNTAPEMIAKLHFYEDHGVEEYYVYDPDRDRLEIWTRGPTGSAFAQRNPRTFVSPRMGITFDTSGDELVVRYPDGQPFLTLPDERSLRLRSQQLSAVALAARERAEAEAREAKAEAREAKAEAREAEAARQQAEAARQQAEAEAEQAEAARLVEAVARQQAEAEAQQAEAARQQAEAARQQAEAEAEQAEAARLVEATARQQAEAAQHAAEVAQGLTDATLGDTRQQLRRIRDLGRLARAGQATPQQLAELQTLEDAVNGN